MYDYQDNSIILQVNQTVAYVLQNLAEYRRYNKKKTGLYLNGFILCLRIIQNATGGQVVITDVRPSINTVTGQVDYAKYSIYYK